MPLTLTITEGLLPVDGKKSALQQLGQLMLKWHGLSGNKVMTPNVIGSLHEVSPDLLFIGGNQQQVAFIEWKVPGFAFVLPEIQQGYVAEATQVLFDLCEGRLPKENIWVNVVHAVDGTWGIAGEALSNQQLMEAVAQG